MYRVASDDHAAIEHVKSLVRSEYARLQMLHGNDARSLELVAIDLGLSLNDCAIAIGRNDLLDEIGNTWTLEFPEIGPSALRRP